MALVPPWLQGMGDAARPPKVSDFEAKAEDSLGPRDSSEVSHSLVAYNADDGSKQQAAETGDKATRASRNVIVSPKQSIGSESVKVDPCHSENLASVIFLQ